MNKKINFFIMCLIFLNGCPQSTVLVGPIITTVATENVYQAGLSYGVNHSIEKNTGKSAGEHISEVLKPKKKEIKIEEDFIALVEAQIKKTREKFFIKSN